MDSMEWDPEYFDEDYPEWDPEFLPGLPSPSAALARRFFPSRRRPTPSRPPARPMGPPRPMGTATAPPAAMSAVMDRLRMLDERQKATTTQLAVLQQRTAAQQSSETFGPLATGAAGAFALGLKNRDAFSPFITHGLPVAQLLLASRGRAISSGFRANPWSTLGFPLAAVLLTVFRDKIPGLAPRTVDPPDVSVTPDGAGGFIVTVRKPTGSVLRFTRQAGGEPGDPGTGDAVFPTVARLAAGDRLKIRAFLDGTASDPVLVAAP
jgi:hypothetical protein